MNKERRARFSDVIACLEDAKGQLADIQMEEQDALDNMPEGLQCSSRGEKMQEYIDLMDEASGNIEDAISFIEDNLVK